MLPPLIFIGVIAVLGLALFIAIRRVLKNDREISERSAKERRAIAAAQAVKRIQERVAAENQRYKARIAREKLEHEHEKQRKDAEAVPDSGLGAALDDELGK